MSDPQGHRLSGRTEHVTAFDPAAWRDSATYLFGLDLFNHAYYWEAHEVWEGLWHACGRKGVIGDFLKGLIKLAAAGVKVREGVAGGVHSHARRAAELFRRVADEVGGQQARYLGLRLSDLVNFTAGILDRSLIRAHNPEVAVAVVFHASLLPCGEEDAWSSRGNRPRNN